jgi:hypothetical protein
MRVAAADCAAGVSAAQLDWRALARDLAFWGVTLLETTHVLADERVILYEALRAARQQRTIDSYAREWFETPQCA